MITVLHEVGEPAVIGVSGTGGESAAVQGSGDASVAADARSNVFNIRQKSK